MKAALYLFFGMAIFGSATPVSKLVGMELPILTASLLRVLLGSLFLLAFVYKDLFKNIKKIEKESWFYISMISVFGMVGFTVFLIWGMKSVTGVVGSLIMSITPALTGLASYIFLGSPMGAKRLTALGLGVIGVLTINVFGEKFGFEATMASYIGAGLVFLAICCEAAYTLIGKKMTDSISPLLVTFLASTLSIPLFFVLSFFETQSINWSGVSITSWLSLLWWGIGTLGAGSALWYMGLSKAEGSTAAGFMSIMPVTALLLSYFLLDEKFYPVHLVGIFLVLTSVAIMSWIHAHSHKS